MSDPQPKPPQTVSGQPAEKKADDVVKPTFDVLPLTAEVKKSLSEMGYTHPTGVQVACYDPVVRGKDVVVQARTGTGKTTAFGLPIVDQIVRKSGGLQVLGLCPTRELALQVAAEITKLGKHRGIKVTAVYGGAPMGRQIAELEDGAQVVIGTPGRVLDHLRRGTMDASQLRALVLDEADEMLSMGFEKELSQILEKLPKTRQTLLFSATVTGDIDRLVRRMNEPERILLSGDQVGALELTHYFYLSRGDKVRDLMRVLEVENPQSAICFCNTKHDTELVAGALRKAGFAADYISGDLEQAAREKVMNATREGRLRFLVATDVAARGIDISHLTHVINVDFPESAEQYVHRTGRTGRAGRMGTAVSLINAKDIGNLYYLRLTYGLKPIERTLPTDQEVATRREVDLVGKIETMARERPASTEARALARRVLAHDDAESIMAVLLREVLGSQLVSAEEAALARRAKNPPPVVAAPESAPRSEEPKTRDEKRPERPQQVRVQEQAPARAPEQARVQEQARAPEQVRVQEQAPVTRADAPQPRAQEQQERSRERRPEAGPVSAERSALRDRERRGGRVRTTELSDWSPPEEADDESPLIPGETRRERAPRADAPRVDAPRVEAPRVEVPRQDRPRDDRPREDRPPRDREPRDREPRDREPRDREPRDREPRSEDDRVITLTDVTTIFVNSGRRDKVRVADLLELLEKRGAIEPDAVGRIRIRDRNTFLDVRPDVCDRAIAALKGATLYGRTLNAEPARPREDGATEEERPTNPLGNR